MPPQNVQATAVSSTEIMVTWDEIPGLDQNGIIIDYEVQIEPLDFPADIMTNLLTTTNLSILVTSLEEHVNYDISVRAYTRVGPGPYSDPVTERTLEDGKVPMILLYVESSVVLYTLWVFLQNRQHLLKMSEQQPLLPLQSW